MMEIRDWFTALEFDKAAAELVQKDLRQRELEREKRDREFWRVMFGGEADAEPEMTLDAPIKRALPESDDEVIARSMLSRR